MWYCVGYAFAYGVGNPPNRFIGNSMFALKNLSDSPTGSGNGKWSDWVSAPLPIHSLLLEAPSPVPRKSCASAH